MATTIINPAPSNDTSNNGTGLLIGVLTLIVFTALFFIYALPYLRGLSMGGGSGISVNVPKDINVNVQQTK